VRAHRVLSGIRRSRPERAGERCADDCEEDVRHDAHVGEPRADVDADDRAIRYWPWPPMLKRPQRNAKATASPVRISGVVVSSVCVSCTRRVIRVRVPQEPHVRVRERNMDRVIAGGGRTSSAGSFEDPPCTCARGCGPCGQTTIPPMRTRPPRSDRRDDAAGALVERHPPRGRSGAYPSDRSRAVPATRAAHAAASSWRPPRASRSPIPLR